MKKQLKTVLVLTVAALLLSSCLREAAKVDKNSGIGRDNVPAETKSTDTDKETDSETTRDTETTSDTSETKTRKRPRKPHQARTASRGRWKTASIPIHSRLATRADLRLYPRWIRPRPRCLTTKGTTSQAHGTSARQATMRLRERRRIRGTATSLRLIL